MVLGAPIAARFYHALLRKNKEAEAEAVDGSTGFGSCEPWSKLLKRGLDRGI